MAPVLVPLRPSSEHILIVRAPGARDQHGCHSTPFIVGALRARRAPGHSPLLPSSLVPYHSGWPDWSPTARVKRYTWSLQARLPLSLGMAPVLIPLRPSSEHILIVRAPGARDQRGCRSIPFIVRVLRARECPISPTASPPFSSQIPPCCPATSQSSSALHPQVQD